MLRTRSSERISEIGSNAFGRPSVISGMEAATLEARPVAPSTARTRPTVRAVFDVAAVAVPPVAFFVAGWHRRWIADDGLIAARTVRQILAGHGPVFNVGERVETNTSTVWTWLAALISWITRMNVYETFLWMGLVLAPIGLLFGLLGARNIQRRLAPDGPLIPLGAIVLLGITPFWDFVTSGLEESLVFCWLGLCWWLLTRIHPQVPPGAADGANPGLGREVHLAAFVIGLGWLVRPDLALATAGFLGALLVIVRARPRRIIVELVVAGALPAAYEVFRMGYYGLLTPNTALTKEAGSHHLFQGLRYLEDFVSAYHLWVPAIVLALLVQRTVPWQRLARESRIVLATTAGVGLALGGYVVLLGGDFMHARMLLPATFTLLLPFMMIPVPPLGTRTWKQFTAVALVSLGAVVCAAEWRDDLGTSVGANGIADERRFWVAYTHSDHPLDPGPFLVHMDPALRAATHKALAASTPQLVYWDADNHLRTATLNRPGAKVAVEWDALGTLGALLPLDGIAVDGKGLAYPVVAHSDAIPDGRTGHSKSLAPEWIVADYAGLTDNPKEAAAARALQCDRLAEVRTATTGPLTAGRFASNFFHAVVFDGFRFDRDARRAESQLCGPYH